MPFKSFTKVFAATGLIALQVATSLASAQPTNSAPTREKVFRYAFQIAETGFDPVQISDVYSKTVAANIFESLYEYDYLARPLKARPLLAVGMPEATNNYKTWTVRIKQGVYFADDPAFGGKKRELTAEDFVYSYKRHYDPKNKSQNVYLLEALPLLGLDELKAAASRKQEIRMTGNLTHKTN